MGLGAACAASATCMLLAAAFQCGATRAWQVMTEHCFEQVSEVQTSICGTSSQFPIDRFLDSLWRRRHSHGRSLDSSRGHARVDSSNRELKEGGRGRLLCSTTLVSSSIQMAGEATTDVYRVVAAAMSRLVYLAPVRAPDSPAYKAWIAVVCTELQICLSISTACIPFIKPFFEGIEVRSYSNVSRLR